MGSILALLMALDILSGYSIAYSQNGEKHYNLSSSNVSEFTGNTKYTYTDNFVKDSSERIIYQKIGSNILDHSGKIIFSILSQGLSGSDSYEVRGSIIYKNNYPIFQLN